MPSIATSKVAMTMILSRRKAGPWKQDVKKTEGTDSILRPFPALRLARVISLAVQPRSVH